MTRLRRRPTPPPPAPPSVRGRQQKQAQSSVSGEKQQKTSSGARQAATPTSGPVRIRPNLFLSPVVGRARGRTARKTEPEKKTVKFSAVAGESTPDKTGTKKKRVRDVVKDQTSVSTNEKSSGRTRVSKNEKNNLVVKPAVASTDKTSSQSRAKKERGTASQPALQPVAAETRTPSRCRAKRGAVNTAAAVEKTPRRAPVSNGQAPEPPSQPAPVPKGKAPGRTRTKESVPIAAGVRVVPGIETSSRNKTPANKAAAGKSGDQSKAPASKSTAVSAHAGSRAKTTSAVIGEQVKNSAFASVSASDRGRPDPVSEAASMTPDTVLAPDDKQGSVTSLPSLGVDERAEPPKTVGSGRISSVKRPRVDEPVSSSSSVPSAPAAAAITNNSSETPSKRQCQSATSAKAVTFSHKEEVALTPSRFTAILPHPRSPPLPHNAAPIPPADPIPAADPLPASAPIPAVDPLPASAPIPPSMSINEPLKPVATPRHRRLPRHVTSTPCGPPAPPPPVADSAQTCYGFLEDVEAEDAEENVPLEQMVSPVGVSRARPPPRRLRDATNLPSRFNAGRLGRKPAGARPEVTTTVASQLMDPELTFTKVR